METVPKIITFMERLDGDDYSEKHDKNIRRDMDENIDIPT